MSWLRGSFGGVFYCLLVGLLLAIPGVALPILIQLLVDWGLVKAETHWLRPLILGLILVAGLQGMLLLLQLRMLRRLRVKLTLEMASAFVKQLLALPVGFYSQRFTGEISDRLRLNAAVAQTLSGSVSLAMIEVTAVVIYILVMVTFDPLLTLVAVSSVIVNLLTLNWALHQSKNTTIRFAQAKKSGGGSGNFGIAKSRNLESLWHGV
ncbi:MAG: hypothetical protein HC825_03230 [Oscillatoriales cyanobacterium RM1_1_9]|nr:hypothetical protein [Oscillatoriales cyanobacterium RM1_1_9]